jgi:Tol biopolymer transport system component
MTTGTRPFSGDTPASVIWAKQKDTPPSNATRQPLAPRALDVVVERCLAKDPDERWQSVADVGRLLQWIKSNQAADAERHDRPHRAWTERGAWIAATALLVALAFAALWRRPAAPTGEVVRLSVNPPEGMEFAAQTNATVPTPQFAVSPDGRSIAFVATGPERRPALWLRPLQEVDARPVQGTEDAQEPFWSPDSQWIGFFDGLGTLKKVPVSGGTVQTIARGVTDYRGASWGPDDTLLIGTGFEGLYRVSAAGGTPQPVTQLDSSKQEGSHRWPQFLPDGQHYVFTVRAGLAAQRGIYVSALEDKARHLLIRSDGDAQYVAPGYLLFLDGNTLLAHAFDSERRQLVGQPTPVAAGVGRSSRGSGAFSVSRAGTLAYAGAIQRPGRLTWFDRRGTLLGVVGPGGEHDYADFRLSPDEKRLAASLIDPKLSVPDIWLTDLVRGGTSRFTFGLGVVNNAAAVWSPGGERIVFRTNRKGLTELYQKAASAGGNDEPFLLEDLAREASAGGTAITPTDWSPDGKCVVLSTGSPADIWLVPGAGNKKPVILVRSTSDQAHANFSPDGRFIAYSSNESGRYEVYVETLPTSDRKWPISTSGGYEPRWRADGREIYYLAEDRKLMAVPVSSGAAPFGVPTALFQTEVHAGVSVLRTHYVPSRDGTRFLVHTRSGDLVPASITVVLNWTAGLKR